MMRLAMSLIGVMLAAAMPAQGSDDPLLRPIAPESSKRWLEAREPVRLFGNTYSVGFGGLSVALIDTGAGLILIDGAVPQAVPAVEENIRKLGFALEDVKFILSTEPHFDHAGGLAALARDTGATVVASPEAARVLEAGQSGPDDPQLPWLPPFPKVETVRAVKDGETITLGAVTVRAVATPGHTAGSMSWTWQACEQERCLDVVFASSLNPVAPEDFRFSAPANGALVESYRHSIERVRALPCDLLIAAHPDFRNPGPLIDPAACAAYADLFAGRLTGRLQQEAGAGAK